jgi:hypothetical protein
MAIRLLYCLAFIMLHSLLFAEGNEANINKNQHIKLLNLPKPTITAKYKQIKVAVIDDGFRKTHNTIKDFLYANPKEIKENYRDDDKNGYADDIYGWDFANNDNDVSVPEHRKADIFHGTYISGIITKIFSEYLGEKANEYLKIIPIKVYPDESKRGEIQFGYEGIRYAADMGADIICCAWNGGKLRAEDKVALDYAIAKGCLIISTAGNYNTEEAYPPANYQGVYSVCAVDYNLRKIKKSNFSKLYTISAYGENIYGAHPDADNAYISESGTSPACAIVTACAAILKSLSPKSAPDEIMTALMNTADPIDSLNSTYAGKLGAGVPNMNKAIDFILNKNMKYTEFNSGLPKGKIFYKKVISSNKYTIKPFGDYRGVHLILKSFDKNGKITIKSQKDSTIFYGDINSIKNDIYVEDNGAKLEVDIKNSPRSFNFEYYMETIDSTKLFCSGDTYLTADSGTISDGSGDANYANNSVCKWIITAPKGKRIQIDFEQIDTEIDVDYVWIFDGATTRPDDLLAKFSGRILPPRITSFSNEALIWFLTDDKNTAKGWQLKYRFVD